VWDETAVVIEVIWVGAEQKNFLLWDSTAPTTPNLARRAVDFFTRRHSSSRRKQKFDPSGKSPARPHVRSKCPHERMRQAGVTAYAKAPDIASLIRAALAAESASGQTRRFGDVNVTSALPAEADIHRKGRHVSNVP
jgi:hypothetical protein